MGKGEKEKKNCVKFAWFICYNEPEDKFKNHKHKAEFKLFKT